MVDRHHIFTAKLVCVGSCIVCGYAAIAHFEDQPVFGTMYSAILINCALIYCLIYGNAFRNCALFERVKGALRLCASANGRKIERKMIMAQIESIPAVGIQVGDFQMMEKTSTPIFLHYVLINVVSMLVAYKYSQIQTQFQLS